VFNFLDEIGVHVDTIMKNADYQEVQPSLLTAITEEPNKKIEENYKSILTGMYFLSSLNTKLFN